MKKHRITFPLLLLFSSLNCFSQTAEPKKQLGLIVKADVLVPAIALIENQSSASHKRSFYSISIEKQLKQRHSIQLTFWNYSENIRDNNFNVKIKENIFQIIPEYKFFVLKNKPITGPYVGVDIIYEQEHFMFQGYDKPDYWTYVRLAGGLITGYQFYIKNKFVLDFLGGAGAKKTIKNTNQYDISPIWGIDFRFAINIGYKF